MNEAAEPSMLSSSEGSDEDELRVDPLEEGVDTAERWSAAERFGTTAAEVRDGETLEQKLAEERPDVEPEDVPDRPVAATPAVELDESVDDTLVADVDDVAPEESPGRHTAQSDRPEYADQAGGSVAESLRTPPGE